MKPKTGGAQQSKSKLTGGGQKSGKVSEPLKMQWKRQGRRR